MTFHGSIAHFFLVPNNTALPGCTTVTLSIQLGELFLVNRANIFLMVPHFSRFTFILKKKYLLVASNYILYCWLILPSVLPFLTLNTWPITCCFSFWYISVYSYGIFEVLWPTFHGLKTWVAQVGWMFWDCRGSLSGEESEANESLSCFCPFGTHLTLHMK